MSEETGRFLARWAKRKAAARREAGATATTIHDNPDSVAREAELSAPSRGNAVESQNDTASERQQAVQEEVLETAGEPLPDVESLGAGSDFKPFMADGVPLDVKNQALRKLWASNPLYNHIDMLDDYCEDYTDAACAVPGIKTAYKVGKGFVKELSEAEDTDDSNQGGDMGENPEDLPLVEDKGDTETSLLTDNEEVEMGAVEPVGTNGKTKTL